jgi:hypothetical protein
MTLAQMIEAVDEARQVEYYSQITQQHERRQTWPPGSSITDREMQHVRGKEQWSLTLTTLKSRNGSQSASVKPSRLIPGLPRLTWCYAQTLDPYGVDPNLPEEYQCVGRESLVRRPGSDIWVWFGDLPNETLKRLREKHRGL